MDKISDSSSTNSTLCGTELSKSCDCELLLLLDVLTNLCDKGVECRPDLDVLPKRNAAFHYCTLHILLHLFYTKTHAKKGNYAMFSN